MSLALRVLGGVFMTERERFLEVMVNFNTKVPSLKWEFGYWGETLNNWYKQGLPKEHYIPVPDKYTSPSSSIYTKAWTARNKYVGPGEYPKGFVLMAGGLYWPTQGFAKDEEVRTFFKMDNTQQLVDVNLFFSPAFEAETLEEDDNSLKYMDLDGVIRLFLKESATMASGWEWPIKDKKSWNKLKDERINLKNVKDRLPANWKEKTAEYQDRTYPLGFGGYPMGFFGTLAHLIGYDNLFYMYYDDPVLIHDIMGTFTDLWIAVFEEVVSEAEIDHLQVWEDISYGSGCMVSEAIMREFMLPYYKRLVSFVKSKGVKIVLVDTDGDCRSIIPFFIECGVTGMYPFEVNCGMDVREVRHEFPELSLMGGISKSLAAQGKEQIDVQLEKARDVLKTGGYIPYFDHFTPPEVHFKEFSYYRTRLNEIIDETAASGDV
jgi:uroporphyrinogen decarboxylase